ncbi:MAG TPA: oligopeptide transporter, OPT family [Polyangiales bacterium]|nr:oligopeptide transporter, OPT family [Polyangiales bacterium]
MSKQAAPESALSSTEPSPITPYVSADKVLPEFTLQAVVLGIVLAGIFNAANAYVGLKIGLTVSASIPSAVISMGVLRGLLRRGTILENNSVHAFASVGEGLAAAIIFTVPALLFLGGEITPATVFLLGTVGGFLGILMMIPLRRALCVKEHHTLPFPEGTACAKVLVAGDRGGVTAKPVFGGILFGAVFEFLRNGAKLFVADPIYSFRSLHKATFGYSVSPLLVGIGWLVGIRIAGVMLAGGLLGYTVIIPMIDYFGAYNIIAPGKKPIDAMAWNEIRRAYLVYIGAGGVAFGGLASLVRALPDIGSSLKASLAALRDSRKSAAAATGPVGGERERIAVTVAGAILGLLVGMFGFDDAASSSDLSGLKVHVNWALAPVGAIAGAGLFHLLGWYAATATRGQERTERDLPLPLVGLGVLAALLILWLTPRFGISLGEAIVTVIFAFLFVAVSARMVGLIGTTNQPVSGMTITALMALTIVFANVFHHSESTIKISAIMAGAVVCIATSLSGDLSQDLKTATLIGATPWKVQLAQLLGTLGAAVRTGFVLLILHQAYKIGSEAVPAPQATLMAALVEGATGGGLPWLLMLFGGLIGLCCQLLGVSALAFSIGLYLPINNWPSIFLGGVLSWWVRRKQKSSELGEDSDTGSLWAAGLVAGEAICGLAIALLTVGGVADKVVMRHHGEPGSLVDGPPENFAEFGLSTAIMLVVLAVFYFVAKKPQPTAAAESR